jgi:glycosyltransferase involved in cell wall biosynthesis
MIVQNEAEVICRSLESIHNIANEIVVLDTGSEDATAEIARKWGAKVHHFGWTGSFAEARNTCMGWATGDWILWLDAGEQLSQNSAQKLREYIDRRPSRNNAYLMMVETPPADSLASPEQIAQVRLMPHHAGLCFEGRVRENIQRSLVAAGMEIETAPGRIHRHPREHAPSRKSARARRNLILVNMEKRENPREDVRLLLAEGDAAAELGFNERARDAYTRAIELAAPGSPAMLEAYYGLLSCYNNHPQLCDCQLEIGLKALETFPFDVQLLLAMGGVLQNKERLDMACRSFEIAAKYGQIELSVWHLREVTEVATACWCMCLQLQGRSREALDALDEALTRYPQSARLLRHGVELSIKMDRAQKALDYCKRLLPDGEDSALFGDVILGACRAAKCDWLGAVGHLQSAYVMGCRHPLCLRWLTIALMGGGAIEAARPVVDEWRQAEPDHPDMLVYWNAANGTVRTPGEIVSEELALPQTTDRQYRLDNGVATAEIPPLGLPNLGQTTSFDTMHHAGN